MLRHAVSLSDQQIQVLIEAGESDLLEFKREWFDLDHAEGKASLAKAVLAVANTVRPDAPGFLLFGIDDERRGSQLVGVLAPPEPETVANVLAQYVHPPADAHCRHYPFRGQMISILTVCWSPARPHHSVREHPGILSTNVIYVRRDRTVGTATLPEIEAMIREKDARLGPVISRELIQCGFVQKSDSSGTGVVTARVTNVTTEPVGGVDVTFDVRTAWNPELFERSRRLINATLKPGESREVELRLSDVNFYVARFDPKTGKLEVHYVRPGSYVGARWFDVTLYVYYRDRDGFIRQINQHIAVDG